MIPTTASGGVEPQSAASQLEADLKSELTAFLEETVRKDGLASTNYSSMPAQIAAGVLHLRMNGIRWEETAFSRYHIGCGTANRCLASLLAADILGQMVGLNHKDIRAALKIPTEVTESSLGLTIAYPTGEANPYRAYLWIKASLFMKERAHREALESYRYDMARPVF